MKKLLIVVVLVLTVPQLKGQYLASGFIGLISTANEGGYEGSMTWYNNSPATIHGLKAAWHLGERFKVGYTIHYGNNVVNSLMVNQRYRLYMIETGFYLE